MGVGGRFMGSHMSRGQHSQGHGCWYSYPQRSGNPESVVGREAVGDMTPDLGSWRALSTLWLGLTSRTIPHSAVWRPVQ